MKYHDMSMKIGSKLREVHSQHSTLSYYDMGMEIGFNVCFVVSTRGDISADMENMSIEQVIDKFLSKKKKKHDRVQ